MINTWIPSQAEDDGKEFMNNTKINKRVLLTGGGTGGSVVPVLAIYDELKKSSPDINFEVQWIGTAEGPEKILMEREKIPFKAIKWGKLRRYWSWQNLIDPFFIKYGFYQSLFFLIKWRPDVVITAGSFVSVPVIWAAWVLRIPILIHQLDMRPGLANKIMSKFATVITVTFEKSLKDYGRKAVLTGNPVRGIIGNLAMPKKEAIEKLGFNNFKPIILILGGGTGSDFINKMVLDNLSELIKKFQIVHITGKDRMNTADKNFDLPNYKSFEFLDTTGMLKSFTAADLVISRCGIGILTELSYLGKPSILIPIPDSHQEDNAQVFADKKGAIVLSQKNINAGIFMENILNIFGNQELREELSKNIQGIIKTNAGGKIVEEIRKLIK